MMEGRWDSGRWGADLGRWDADSGRGDALGNRVADSGQRSGLGAKEQTWGKGAD